MGRPQKKGPERPPPLVLPQAPVFTPSLSEWADPLKYIQEVVRPAAEATAGIAKIVPPPGWAEGLAADFALPLGALSFPARLQRVDQLQQRDTSLARARWEAEFAAWHKARGSRPPKPQAVYKGQAVPLHRLASVVNRRGGYDAVTAAKEWRELAGILEVEDRGGSAAYALRLLYQRTLLEYERHQRQPGRGREPPLDTSVQQEEQQRQDDQQRQQACIEEAAGEAPPPHHGAQSLAAEGPAAAAQEEAGGPQLQQEAQRVGEDEAAKTLGAPGSAAAQDSTQLSEAGTRHRSPTPPQRRISSRPRRPPRSRLADELAAQEAVPGRARRRRSAAAGATDADGRPSPDLASMFCQHCGGGHVEDQIVLCDACDRGWHTFCVAPPLATVPAGEWVCPSCRAKEWNAFAFQDTEDYTLEEFKATAAEFEATWFGSAEAAAALTVGEREAEFWRIVEEAEDVVEVLYGNDLDSLHCGSGFPRGPPLGSSASPYAGDGWNLSVMPRLGGAYSSLLRGVEGHIAGVTVPWVYIGMLFSSFCWHVEDHMFYSLNYNHWGAPKCWYGVPGWAAPRFEAVFRAALPDQFEAQPDLLFQIMSMLSPRVLQQHGVPICSTTQQAGQFVVTFPASYHCGFCAGVNCGEAVNFATADWLHRGAEALARYRHFHRPGVISHERVLLRAAREDPSPHTCYWVERELRRVIEEEAALRTKLWSQGLVRSRRASQQHADEQRGPGRQQPAKRQRVLLNHGTAGEQGQQSTQGAGDGHAADVAGATDDDPECRICHLPCHLSSVECPCRPGAAACLHHAHHLCGCSWAQRLLAYRHSLEELEDLHARVAARVPAELAARLDATEAALAAAEAAAEREAAWPAVEAGPESVEQGRLEQSEPLALGQARPGAPHALTCPDPGPADAAALPARQAALAARRAQWLASARAVLEGPGGATAAAAVRAIAAEAEQYLWGCGDEMPAVRDAAARLLAAASFVARVDAAQRSKLPLEQLDALLAVSPPPLADVPGLDRVREAASAAHAWLRRAECLAQSPPPEPHVLEGLASEAATLHAAVPQALELRRRLAAARKARGQGLAGAGKRRELGP